MHRLWNFIGIVFLLLFHSLAVESGIIISPYSVALGEIGQTANNANDNGNNTQIVYTVYQPTTAGSVSYCHGNVGNVTGSNAVGVGIWNSSGTILASGEANSSGTSDNWINVTLNTSVVLSDSTDYILGFMSETDSSWSPSVDAETGFETRDSPTVTYSDPLPSFDTGSSSQSLNNFRVTIICNNSAGDPS